MSKDDGLTLLLLFAIGPMKEKKCGDQAFFNKVIRFLRGDSALKNEVVKLIPKKLNLAWACLKIINKDNPLALETVTVYTLSSKGQEDLAHSAFVKMGHNLESAVFGGTVLSLNSKKKGIGVITPSGEKARIQFLSPFEEDLAPGDLIAYHHKHLVCKIDRETFDRLNKINNA